MIRQIPNKICYSSPTASPAPARRGDTLKPSPA